MNLRWLKKRGSFVADSELVDPKELEVIELHKHSEAKAFVQEHHYSNSTPTIIRAFALLQGRVLQRLVGVAIFSRGSNDKTLTNAFPGSADESLELGRFVLLDGVKQNAETVFLSRCFKSLRKDLRGVVSFSDPHPRRTQSGSLVFVGHFGRIYQASSAVYTGRATPRTLHLFEDGTVFDARTQQKVREGPGEKGFVYSSQLLIDRGAAPLQPGENPTEWLRTWKAALTRPARHYGNHRYLFPFHDSDRRRIQTLQQPYPKTIEAIL